MTHPINVSSSLRTDPQVQDYGRGVGGLPASQATARTVRNAALKWRATPMSHLCGCVKPSKATCCQSETLRVVDDGRLWQQSHVAVEMSRARAASIMGAVTSSSKLRSDVISTSSWLRWASETPPTDAQYLLL